MGSPLPERPDPGQLRRQAGDLQHAANGGEPGALARIRAVHPTTSSGERVPPAAAQLAIARECGFASWPRLKTEVELLGRGRAERVDTFLEASVGAVHARAAQMLLDAGADPMASGLIGCGHYVGHSRDCESSPELDAGSSKLPPVAEFNPRAVRSTWSSPETKLGDKRAAANSRSAGHTL